MIKAMVFDLDGTLVDTAPDLLAAINEVRRTAGRPPAPMHEFRTEITGGTAHNIVPDHCRVVWGIRGMPETDVPALVDEIQAFADGQLTGADITYVRRAKAEMLSADGILELTIPLSQRRQENADVPPRCGRRAHCPTLFAFSLRRVQ